MNLWAKRMLLTAVAATLSLLGAEVLCRAFVVADDGTLTEDMPWLRTEVYRLVGGRGYEFIPKATDEINNLGMRGPDREERKPDHVFRVLVLGDSVAYGVGVRPDETFSMQLEAILSRASTSRAVEVLNSGVPGYNALQQLDYLVHRGLTLDPDLVIVAFCPNDVQTTPIVFRVGDELRAYRHEKGESSYRLWLIERSSLFRLFLRGVEMRRSSEDSKRRSGNDKERNLEAMGEIARVLSERRIPVIAILFPYLKQDFAEYDRAHLHTAVTRLYEEAGAPVIDLHRAWMERGNTAYRLPNSPRDTVHPNVAGHLSAAQLLAESIAERGYLHDN